MTDTKEQPQNENRQFDVLYETLCEVQKGLLDNTARAAGFLLLATGWIATSETARSFLKADAVAKYIMIAAIGGAYVCYVCAAIKARRISVRTSALLDELRFMPSSYYACRVIDTRLLGLAVLANLFITLLAMSLFSRV
jgi:hypothetical protein